MVLKFLQIYSPFGVNLSSEVPLGGTKDDGLKKWLFFRFAEGVRQDCGPNNNTNCRTALARDFRRIAAFSNLQDPPQAESYSLDHSPA